ncbi:unnamed protein product [Boreogadus saida]
MSEHASKKDENNGITTPYCVNAGTMAEGLRCLVFKEFWTSPAQHGGPLKESLKGPQTNDMPERNSEPQLRVNPPEERQLVEQNVEPGEVEAPARTPPPVSDAPTPTTGPNLCTLHPLLLCTNITKRDQGPTPPGALGRCNNTPTRESLHGPALLLLIPPPWRTLIPHME